MPPRTFKVMWPYTKSGLDKYQELGCPKTVPWSFVAPHEARAVANHGQTLEGLHRRGGLSPIELVAVLDDKDLRWVFSSTAATVEKCVARLNQLLEEYGTEGG